MSVRVIFRGRSFPVRRLGHGNSADGSARLPNVVPASAKLADAGVIECTGQALAAIAFPSPASGIVTVTYQLAFSIAAGG